MNKTSAAIVHSASLREVLFHVRLRHTLSPLLVHA